MYIKSFEHGGGGTEEEKHSRVGWIGVSRATTTTYSYSCNDADDGLPQISQWRQTAFLKTNNMKTLIYLIRDLGIYH